MESSIIAALIAATATILTTLLTVKATRSRVFSPYQKDFVERQIFELLAPMDKLMTFHAFENWSDIRLHLKSLVEQNYALVPPLVLSELVPLLLLEEISNKQFLKLQAVISSAYNWARKEVGHSYDGSKIQKGAAPISKEREIRRLIFSSFLIVCMTYAISIGVIFLLLRFVP